MLTGVKSMRLHRDPYDGRDHPQWYVNSITFLSCLSFIVTIFLLSKGLK